MIPILAAAAILATASGGSAEQRPPAGSYGFNWLDPDSRCLEVTAKELPLSATCSVSSNAFGLSLEARVCKVSAKVELMVYETAAQCREALETMQANGP